MRTETRLGRSALTELSIGAGLGLVAVALYWLWSFWGRAFQAAVALIGVSFLLLLVRYPGIGSFIFGFILLSGLSVFIPGSTSLFFGAMFLILVFRKLVKADTNWRLTSFLAAVAVFVVWFQLSGLWVDQHNNYNWVLAYRILFGLLILQELVQSVSDYLIFTIGAACGMIFTSISAIFSAYQFYTTGAAEQVAGAVAEIEKARFYGHWTDPNVMAVTLVAFMGLTLAFWRTRISWRIRWLMGVATCLTAVTIAISMSRGAILGCAIVILAMIAVERRRVLLLSLFSLLAFFVLTIVPIDLIGRVVSIVEGDASTSERTNLALSAVKLFIDAPLFGGGMGSLEHNILLHMKHLPHAFIAHNTYADIAVDGGLVGLGLFFWCLWYSFRALKWKNWHVDNSDPVQMLNAGLRASLLGTMFMILTLSMIAYVPMWTLFALAASFLYVQKFSLSTKMSSESNILTSPNRLG